MDASMTLHRARLMAQSRGNHAGWPRSHARRADASVDIHMGVRAVALAHHAPSASESREIPARMARVQRENQTDSRVDGHGSRPGMRAKAHADHRDGHDPNRDSRPRTARDARPSSPGARAGRERGAPLDRARVRVEDGRARAWVEATSGLATSCKPTTCSSGPSSRSCSSNWPRATSCSPQRRAMRRERKPGLALQPRIYVGVGSEEKGRYLSMAATLQH
jgi:hypothetical protein